MQWVIFLINDKEPLMFINTKSIVSDGLVQNKFDSRENKRKFIEESVGTLSDKEIKKIKSMVELYNRNQMVYCKVILENDSIVGIPILCKNGILSIKKSDSSILEIKLTKIKAVEIVHF